MVSSIFKKYMCVWVCVGLRGFVCVSTGPAEPHLWDLLELVLQVGVSCQVGAGNPVLVF